MKRTSSEVETQIAFLYNNDFGGRIKIAKELKMPLGTVADICSRLGLRGKYKAGAPLGNHNNRRKSG